MHTKDFYKILTDTIVTAMTNDPGHWTKPWTGPGGSPVNALTGKHYHGSNHIMLAFAGYGSPYWATYKQWTELGAHVLRGQHGTPGIYWNWRDVIDPKTGETERVPFGRTFYVFNAEQIDGWTPPELETPNPDERIAHAEAWIAATGALINHRGDGAYYTPANDWITVPPFASFTSADAYYATVAHELGHWTGAEIRLNRDLTGRFGSHAYAMEELVAELTSAFTMAHLGLTHEPRPDHAQYLRHWLEVAAEDETAIYKTAQLAAKALDYLTTAAGETDTGNGPTTTELEPLELETTGV